MVRIGRKGEEVVEVKLWKPEADILIFLSYLITCRIWYSVVRAYVEVPRLVGASNFLFELHPTPILLGSF